MVAAKGQVTAAAKPVPLKALELDPLTAADDDGFLNLIEREKNLTEFVKNGLPGLY